MAGLFRGIESLVDPIWSLGDRGRNQPAPVDPHPQPAPFDEFRQRSSSAEGRMEEQHKTGGKTLRSCLKQKGTPEWWQERGASSHLHAHITWSPEVSRSNSPEPQRETRGAAASSVARTTASQKAVMATSRAVCIAQAASQMAASHAAGLPPRQPKRATIVIGPDELNPYSHSSLYGDAGGAHATGKQGTPHPVARGRRDDALSSSAPSGHRGLSPHATPPGMRAASPQGPKFPSPLAADGRRAPSPEPSAAHGGMRRGASASSPSPLATPTKRAPSPQGMHSPSPHMEGPTRHSSGGSVARSPGAGVPRGSSPENGRPRSSYSAFPDPRPPSGSSKVGTPQRAPSAERHAHSAFPDPKTSRSSSSEPRHELHERKVLQTPPLR